MSLKLKNKKTNIGSNQVTPILRQFNQCTQFANFLAKEIFPVPFSFPLNPWQAGGRVCHAGWVASSLLMAFPRVFFSPTGKRSVVRGWRAPANSCTDVTPDPTQGIKGEGKSVRAQLAASPLSERCISL